MTTAIRVVIVDDHAIFRQGLLRMFEDIEDVDIVATAGDAATAAAALARHKPDVALVDLNLGGSGGLEVLRGARELERAPALVVLTMRADADSAARSLAAGACGFCIKDQPFDELLRAVRMAAQGGEFVTPPIAALLRAKTTVRPVLTAREREIVALVAAGLTSASIGKRLYISPRTVDTHRRNIMRKLNLKNSAALAAYASEHGLAGDG